VSRFLARHRTDDGYVAVLVALLVGTVFIPLSAVGVDISRWYVEVQRVQKAADAAAMAGVTYMPNDFTSARTTALAMAARNGFDNSGGDVVTVTAGDIPSQLKVTVESRVGNAFGSALGVGSTTVTRSAVADYTAPAPMGSPCNTFGNEPASTSGAAQPVGSALPTSEGSTCNNTPNFWAAVEGPQTDKTQGDRYQTVRCTESNNARTTTYGCTGGTNAEYRKDGYYFAVHVEAGAVGQPIDVQVYDPVYANAGIYCESLPAAKSLSDDMNPFTPSDGKDRYAAGSSKSPNRFCPGDISVGSPPSNAPATTTTFVMRGATETNNPAKSTPYAGCAHQFNGFKTAPSASQLKSGQSSYNPQLAQVFHEWYSLCSFTPDRAGDYFLQVRTNLAFTGPATYKNDTKTSVQSVIATPAAAALDTAGTTSQGAGANSFTLRAVPAAPSARSAVSVSGWDRMPVLQIAPSSTATFNLARALPNTKGQYLTFDFFDASDGSSGSVTVLPPPAADPATPGSINSPGGIPGCRWGKNDTLPKNYTGLSSCSVSVTGSQTDGQLVHMVIPIPEDYSCDDSTLTGCWFQVKMAYSGNVTDLTTWSANIGGDPVRLVE